jgi:single-strand DNA-binding protein
MANSLNKVTLIGNVGRDPEIRTTQDGREVANFSIATTESWKDKVSGERREKTEWHRIVIFPLPLVNVIRNYVSKGTKLYVEGALQTRKWVDQSGAEKYTTEVVLQAYNSTLVILDSRSNGSDSLSEPAMAMAGGGSKSPLHMVDDKEFVVEDMDDEIPF